MTKGYRLPAKWVIHTVGPVWRGGNHNEEQLLADCYRACLDLAQRSGIKSIAFPSISTGAYRFPVEKASRIALEVIRDHLDKNPLPENVLIVCFDTATHEAYARLLQET